MTTPPNLSRLRELLEKATPGTWMAAPFSSVVGRGIVSTHEGRMIGQIVEHEDAPGNAALIVAAVNALPDLLTQLESLQARIAELEGALRPFSDAWDVVTHDAVVLGKLTMAQLGELAAHEISGVHFRNAAWTLQQKDSANG